MSILNVIRYQIRPEKTLEWEGAIAEVTARANERNDPLLWNTLQIMAGKIGAYVIAIPSESFGAAVGMERADALVARLFESADAERLLVAVTSAIQSVERVILRDRPELGYPAEDDAGEMRAAVVTRAVVRPGHREACEELFRKVAEAIPKTDDVRRFTTYQPLVGDLRELATARPIRELTELDQATPVEGLLNQAFGAAEGGLIFRQGIEGFESLTSEVLSVRTDLSRS